MSKIELHYNDPEGDEPHRFPPAADPARARYTAAVTVRGATDAAEREMHVILRYRIGGEPRWEGAARSLYPLWPADGEHAFLFRNGVAERRFHLIAGLEEGGLFSA